MKEHFVSTEITNDIAYITFFHPKSNSFPSEQLQSLAHEIDEAGKNESVKVLVLQSVGETVFCAGASFEELLLLNEKDKATKFFMGFANVLLAMKNCPKFIIGKVIGKAVGGGVGLVSGCDYAIAMNNANIRLSELSIGIGPFVIEPAISRKIGVNAFSEMTLNPKEWKSANWAFEKGIYNKVYENQTLVEEEVDKMAKDLSKYSLDAMKHLKKILWENANNWETIMPIRAAMSGELVLTENTKNILNALKP